MNNRYKIVNGKAIYMRPKGHFDDENNFHIKNDYAKFLKYDKREIEENYEMRMLGQRLKWEYETYGECDEIDLQRYLKWLMA